MERADSEGDARRGVYKTIDSVTAFIESEARDHDSGSEVGQLASASQGNHETEQRTTPLGEDGKSEISTSVDIADGDRLVDVQGAIDKFTRDANGKFFGSTPSRYRNTFKRFAEFANLETMTRRQLQGKKGHDLLVDFLKTISRPTILNTNSGLRAFWTLGLGFKPGTYPVDIRADLGRLPPTLKRQTPNDDVVMPWVSALEFEDDKYLNGIIRHMFQLGPRPANICLLNNEHVVLRNGKPYAIRTTGREEGNKTYAPTIARLPPDMVQSISDIWALNPEHLPGHPLYPFRDANGVIHPRKRMSTTNYQVEWERFQKKHKLNPLMRVSLRHWVATKCARALLPGPVTQAMQGQAMGVGNGMRGVYDQPSDEAIYAEQEKYIPFGTIGVVCPHVVDIAEDLPGELIDGLSKAVGGEMTVSEFADELRAYLDRRRKQESKESSPPTFLTV